MVAVQPPRALPGRIDVEQAAVALIGARRRRVQQQSRTFRFHRFVRQADRLQYNDRILKAATRPGVVGPAADRRTAGCAG
jgi:hypothetical protein